MFGFASRMQGKRIYLNSQEARIPLGGLKLAFPGSGKQPKEVALHYSNVRAKVKN